MASLFTTVPGQTIKGFAGKRIPVPFYLQFVPGYVVEAIHSDQSIKYSGDSTINSIIAIPHVTKKVFVRRSNLDEENRYYPLFRGITDVPSKGDPVLLCTIGNTNYYLGPLATANNNPTWNNDPLLYNEPNIGDDKYINKKGNTPNSESPNFHKSKLFKRLVKIPKSNLDFGNAINETTGDTILEGRHGNSIRIGSRSNNPYVFISNGRNENNIVESIGDGSLISITKHGTLKDHFGATTNINDDTISEFILSSDMVIDNKRLMGSLIGSLNEVDDSYPLIYGYKLNQMLLNSNRIIINTKKDDIYLSSNKDIHIGTGRHLTISTNKNIVIESEKTYLGNPNKEDNKDGEESLMEPMLLGNKVLEIFSDLLGVLKEANGLVQGVAVPLVDPTMAPLLNKITPIEKKLNSILSKYHYIEPNKGNK